MFACAMRSGDGCQSIVSVVIAMGALLLSEWLSRRAARRVGGA